MFGLVCLEDEREGEGEDEGERERGRTGDGEGESEERRGKGDRRKVGGKEREKRTSDYINSRERRR